MIYLIDELTIPEFLELLSDNTPSHVCYHVFTDSGVFLNLKFGLN